MDSPNRMALDLVDEAIDFADELNVGIHHLDTGAAVLDFGVDVPGGIEAGLLLTEVATGGLATVQTRVGSVTGATLTNVEVSTDHPALALVGCQAPEWDLEVDGSPAVAGGPAQLLRQRSEPVESVAFEESADFAVAVVEADRIPGDDLVATVATEAGVPTSGVFVLVTPANTVTGRVAFAARAAERALHWLAATGFDPADVRSATAAAPVAPLSPSDAGGVARPAAAIAHGGRAHLVLETTIEAPDRFVDDSGRPTLDGVDDDGPAPAQVTMDVLGGPTDSVGEVDEEQLAAGLEL